MSVKMHFLLFFSIMLACTLFMGCTNWDWVPPGSKQDGLSEAVCEGTLFGPGGKEPAQGVSVIIRPYDYLSSIDSLKTTGSFISCSTQTDLHGIFSFTKADSIRDGIYCIEASDGHGNRVLIDSVMIKNGNRYRHLSDTLQSPAAIRGKLSRFDDSTEAYVRVYGLDVIVKVNSNGAYSLENLPAGNLRINVSTWQGNGKAYDTVIVAAVTGKTNLPDAILPFELSWNIEKLAINLPFDMFFGNKNCKRLHEDTHNNLWVTGNNHDSISRPGSYCGCKDTRDILNKNNFPEKYFDIDGAFQRLALTGNGTFSGYLYFDVNGNIYFTTEKGYRRSPNEVYINKFDSSFNFIGSRKTLGIYGTFDIGGFIGLIINQIDYVPFPAFSTIEFFDTSTLYPVRSWTMQDKGTILSYQSVNDTVLVGIQLNGDDSINGSYSKAAQVIYFNRNLEEIRRFDVGLLVDSVWCKATDCMSQPRRAKIENIWVTSDGVFVQASNDTTGGPWIFYFEKNVKKFLSLRLQPNESIEFFSKNYAGFVMKTIGSGDSLDFCRYRATTRSR